MSIQQRIKGNAAADKLARAGVESESLPTLELCDDISDTAKSHQVIANVPSPLTNSDESDNEDMTNMDTLKNDLQKSFSQFDKSVESKELNLSMTDSDSLY